MVLGRYLEGDDEFLQPVYFVTDLQVRSACSSAYSQKPNIRTHSEVGMSVQRIHSQLYVQLSLFARVVNSGLEGM